MAFGSSVLFDLNSTVGGVYGGTTWNGISTSLGAGTAPHDGVFNQDTNGDVAANTLYTNTGQQIQDKLSWTVVNSVSSGGGLWGSTGTAGTTPSGYQTLPSEVTDSGFSFNNAANLTFTIGGLSAGSVYTLTFGGNSGMGQTTSINFNFNNMVADSLEGSGGSVSGNRFQVSNPNTTSYALSVQLTADENGIISFTGVRQGGGNSSVGLTYMSLDGEFTLVPEPATASLSLVGLAALLLRRRRA